MDLLRRDQIAGWLAKKYGSVSLLANKLDISRQTAHNLMTGRTIPSYETCQRLGLEVVFMEVPDAERTKIGMESLNDFLSRRSEDMQAAESEAARQALLKSVFSNEFAEFVEKLKQTVGQIGPVDGQSFEWGKQAYLHLKFGNVAAILAQRYTGDKFKVIFGRIPGAMYVSDDAPAQDVWELELDVIGNQFVWNVAGGQGNMRGLSSQDLSQQVMRRLIQYNDEYQEFYRRQVM